MAHEEQHQFTVDELLTRIETLERRLSQRRLRLGSLLRKRVPMALLAGLLAVAVSGATYASMPRAAAVLHGCKGKKGALRIAKTCASGETPVTWNKQGPKGDKGDKGPAGPQGLAGAAGAAGAAGQQGPKGDIGPQGPKGDKGDKGDTGAQGPPGSAGSAWNVTGNAGTTPDTNFLGTTDGQPLVIKTNKTEALRIDTRGYVGAGLTNPTARIDAVSANAIAVMGTNSGPGQGVVGRLGNDSSCLTGTYAVIGCAGNTGATAVRGTSQTGIGVVGDSTTRGVVGTLGSNTPCLGTYGVGGCAGDSGGAGVVGTLGSATLCPGNYALGGCAGATGGMGVFASSSTGVGLHAESSGNRAIEGFAGDGIGVIGASTARGVVGTLGRGSCAGTYAVGGCTGDAFGDGLFARINVAAGGPTAAAVHAINDGGGDIFLGQTAGSRVARIDGTGKGFFNGGTQTGGADYAESMRAANAARLHPGDVLAIDPRYGNAVRASSTPNSPLVLGVYSTKPAVLAIGKHRITDSLVGEVPVAMMGVVPTKVTVQNGPIRAGDMLTTSSKPGYAMKARYVVVGGIAIYPTGTILGKALAPLMRGTGTIQVLLMTR